MPRNPWIAVDTATSPSARAREIYRVWERFLGEGSLEEVRGPIAESWKRSLAAGIDPRSSRAPVLVDSDEVPGRWETHPLATSMELIDACLAEMAEEAGLLVVVSDDAGMLLRITGSDEVRAAAAESMNFVEGTLWSEGGAGTNAIGTALAADHPVQVFAAEHLSESVHRWTCAAAPVHDPETGRLLGAVDLTGWLETAEPHYFALVTATARAVEAQLLADARAADVLLLERYLEDATSHGGSSLLVTARGRVIAPNLQPSLRGAVIDLPPGGGELVLPSGQRGFAEPVGHGEAFVVRVSDASPGRARPVLKMDVLGRNRAAVRVGERRVRLSRRQSEILALLALRPAGMSSEELAADLYGDAGRPATVRVEIYRLRDRLGPWIESEPYRLALDVESDVKRVQALLAGGAVTAAAESYRGPLLPESDAPGIRRERDALDRWLRQAVLSGGDPDALWAWTRSPSGEDDLAAWTRLRGSLAVDDPRFSLAVARCAALRAGRRLD